MLVADLYLLLLMWQLVVVHIMTGTSALLASLALQAPLVLQELLLQLLDLQVQLAVLDLSVQQEPLVFRV
jgi:hypothetical protein